MIAINLNATKNIIKIAILATLTYLTFSIANNPVVPHINYTTEDTTTTPPVYPF
jgi:hypothetical protein